MAEETNTKQRSARPETLRLRMLKSQAGYMPVETRGPDGGVRMVPGPMFVREPKEEYDIPYEEAQRMIQGGLAVIAKAS